MSLEASQEKSRQQMSIATCLWMICAATIITTACVHYATVTNDITSIRREVEKVGRLTADARMSANMYQARANEYTHRWIILDRLNQMGSTLKPIYFDQIETISPIDTSTLTRLDEPAAR